MTLKDFFHFPGNRSASFSARPAEFPMSVGSPVGSVANVLDEELEMDVAAPMANNAVGAEVVPPSVGRRWHGVVARPVGSPQRKHVVLDEGPSSPKFVPDVAPPDEACKNLFGSLDSTEDPGDSDPFLPGIEEARSSYDALCNLSYPDVQRCLDSLTLTELTNFHDVTAVRFVMSNNLLTREAQALSAEVFRLRGEFEALKDKLDFANQERTLLGRDFFPHAIERLLSSDHLSSALADLQEKAMLVGRSQALREVASSGIGVELVDMRILIPMQNKFITELSNPSTRSSFLMWISLSIMLVIAWEARYFVHLRLISYKRESARLDDNFGSVLEAHGRKACDLGSIREESGQKHSLSSWRLPSRCLHQIRLESGFLNTKCDFSPSASVRCADVGARRTEEIDVKVLCEESTKARAYKQRAMDVSKSLAIMEVTVHVNEVLIIVLGGTSIGYGILITDNKRCNNLVGLLFSSSGLQQVIRIFGA
nr:hypothetical protein [Tanacetum cinerariifolium]